MSDYLRDLFQLGQATHQPAFVRKDILSWIADQGRFAIVRLTLDYCPHTDAILPTPSRRLHATVDDVEAGYATLTALYAADEECASEDWFEVWDRDGKVVPPVSANDIFDLPLAGVLDDIPF